METSSNKPIHSMNYGTQTQIPNLHDASELQDM